VREPGPAKWSNGYEEHGKLAHYGGRARITSDERAVAEPEIEPVEGLEREPEMEPDESAAAEGDRAEAGLLGQDGRLRPRELPAQTPRCADG